MEHNQNKLLADACIKFQKARAEFQRAKQVFEAAGYEYDNAVADREKQG